MLPYGDWHKMAGIHVRKYSEKLHVPSENILEFDIKPLCVPIFSSLSAVEKLRQGNIMVRLRMTVLYDLAKKHKALVMGTENKSEYLLGYFTRFGDEASDIEPIQKYYKTQVYQLAEFLKVRREFIEKPPTAGLWEGQTDEGELGFSYKEADQILFLNIDKGLSKSEIIDKGFDKDTVEKVLARMKENEFKHKLPYVIK